MFTFDLEFQKQGQDGVPYPPLCLVYLKSCGRSENVAHGMPTITPACMGVRDFDEQVDGLIEELNELKKIGRRKYAAYERDLKKKMTDR